MTWLILSALAVFVTWHGDYIDWTQKNSSYQEAYSHIYYEKYYTWARCNTPEYYIMGENPIRECENKNMNDRTDDFYIVFDLKNQTRERYRKTQLLWLYITSNYPNAK